jgi:hypothetical protein
MRVLNFPGWGQDGDIESAFVAVKAAVADLPLPELPRLVGKLAEAQAVAMARLTTPSVTTAQPPAVEGNITVKEAARRLAVSPAYVYKNRALLPFVTTIGRRVTCDARGVERWTGVLSVRDTRCHDGRRATENQETPRADSSAVRGDRPAAFEYSCPNGAR